jgi:RpiR family transcriptional regulator, carbohydrate utilization regulator
MTASTRMVSLASAKQRGAVVPYVRAQLPSLLPSDARVASVLVSDPDRFVDLTVAEVAAAAGTSPSTVIRFAQALGFSGFLALKLALAEERLGVRELGPRISADDDPNTILQKVLSGIVATVHEAQSIIDRDQFASAVTAVDGARHVLAFGYAGSYAIAQQTSFALRSVGIDAECPAEGYRQQLQSRRLEAGDVCIAISQSGTTREAVRAVKLAHDQGAVTIAITGHGGSALARSADIVLVAGLPTRSSTLDGLSSRIGQLAVLHALTVAVAFHNLNRTGQALQEYSQVMADHHV